MAKKKRNGFPVYRTYTFTGQDPMIATTLKAVADDKKAAEDSGASRSTLRNWRTQRTRRAFSSTLQAVAMATGKRWALVDK